MDKDSNDTSVPNKTLHFQYFKIRIRGQFWPYVLGPIKQFYVSPNSVHNPQWAVSLSFLSVTLYELLVLVFRP